MAEGIEGGSWRAIERRWTYAMYKKLHDEWNKTPPLRWFAVWYFEYKPPKPQPIIIPIHDEKQQQQAAPKQEQEIPSNVVGLMEWLGNQPNKTFSG